MQKTLKYHFSIQYIGNLEVENHYTALVSGTSRTEALLNALNLHARRFPTWEIESVTYLHEENNEN